MCFGLEHRKPQPQWSMQIHVVARYRVGRRHHNSNAVRRPCPMPAGRPVKVILIHYNRYIRPYISKLHPPSPITQNLILLTYTRVGSWHMALGNTFVRFTKLMVWPFEWFLSWLLANFPLKKRYLCWNIYYTSWRHSALPITPWPLETGSDWPSVKPGGFSARSFALECLLEP